MAYRKADYAKIKPKKKKGPKSPWKPIMVVRTYKMARLGMQELEIARSLGVGSRTWWQWKQQYPELQEAIDMAGKEREGGQTLPEWVYSHLEPDLQKLWDDIGKWEKQPNGVNKIELMLSDSGKRVRQQLFLHALCSLSFSPSRALQKVHLTKIELNNWINNDPEFARLVEEIDWHKGNFFEESLVQLVQQGEKGAVIFANKTYNAQRGYGVKAKLDVHHTGQVGHLHAVLDLADLIPYLKDTTRDELLEAIEKREAVMSPRQLTAQELVSSSIANLPDEPE